jgi:hypothetical protein
MSFITLQSQRRVPVAPRAVNAALAKALKGAGFQLTSEQLTAVEAKRGSQVASVAMQSKLPIRVAARIGPDGTGSVIDLEVRDDSRVPASRFMGMSAAFTRALDEVQQALDAGLLALAPGATFSEPRRNNTAANLGVIDTANAATISAGDKVAAKANQLLGGRRKETAPQAWKGLAGVFLVSPAGTAALEMMDVQALLSAGTLVTLRPGGMPPNLVADVETLVMRLEQELSGHETHTLTIAVTAAEQPVVEFLRQQSRIREALPLRTMMVCQTCRFEKIVNPDYQRLAKRNNRLKTLLGAVGASWGGSGGLRAFVAVGKVIGTAGLDPDFVCPRCQGTAHDDYVITYCPRCGDRRMESMLRACPKCKHDFRDDAPAERLWHAETSLMIPTAVARAAPEAVAALSAPPAKTAAAAPATPSTRAPTAPASWYADPLGQHQYRYWNGADWTEHVADNGTEATAPI